jgi:hypothetical protein
MKLDTQDKQVLHLHFGFLVLGAVLGVLVGHPNHLVLGISLGSLLGTLIPGAYAGRLLSRNAEKCGKLTRVSAAVFDNGWIRGDVSRPAVEEIRGRVYITWFGFLVGALVAGFALNSALVGTVAAAAFGGLLFWFANRCFSS